MCGKVWTCVVQCEMCGLMGSSVVYCGTVCQSVCPEVHIANKGEQQTVGGPHEV